ncbi:MAG: TonB-dependent receptor plug domain-containing protein [Treponema sp.]|nr:TonB-dependent receptor plug domain-containing protein [Treponema sp.]
MYKKSAGTIQKICAVCACVFAALSLHARDASVTVEDAELGLPLEGAVIRSPDGSEYVCGEDGTASFPVPDDRSVVIEAAYPGYENGKLAITPERDTYTLGLSLSGIMESRELVIEARVPGSSGTETGRGITVSEREIALTGEIGLVEDVMTSIKLLPGVGYAGIFNAMPSIRGGDPGDMTASLDGFYIENPYYWGGGFSIFDPRTVESARLSHGVFSVRYGHTISGLLEVSSKKPSSTETEFELGLSTSAVNANLSLPLAGRGGIMFTGRVTYYDPFVWAAKKISAFVPAIDIINSVKTAPYIRSGAVTGNYRFSGDLELSFSGFWGSDGVGVARENSPDIFRKMDTYFTWANHQGFVTGALSWNPRSDMLVKATAGAGYRQSRFDTAIQYDVSMPGAVPAGFHLVDRDKALQVTKAANVQGRVDYDWDLGNGFLFASGIQELYSRWAVTGDYHTRLEMTVERYRREYFLLNGTYPVLPVSSGSMINYPLSYSLSSANNAFAGSAYTLLEYGTPGLRFGADPRFRAELGLRVDHLYIMGADFSINTIPTANPRLNLDLGVLKDRGPVKSLSVSAGTGLFSSVIDAISFLEKRYGVDDYELKPARSWTSVAGTKVEFPWDLTLNLEGYYKYVFNRAYVPIHTRPGMGSEDIQAFFDGEGRIWGIDLMLQKIQSRYLDGWISYSFNYARYRDPQGIDTGFSAGNGGIGTGGGGTRGSAWYFPSYHRFHYLNLVLNLRPARHLNISMRLGVASGVLLPVIETNIEPRKVLLLDSGGLITKYYRTTRLDDSNRMGASVPMDLKLSVYGFNIKGKVQSEMYIALENVLVLLYSAKGNPSFNPYTGEVFEGLSSSYELPIPMISIGYRWSY